MVSVLKQHLRVFNIFKTGKSGSIISYHPQKQQNSSVDCGVFVVKWAQHIEEGRPSDFTQEQMVAFRYSLILDVSDGFLSMLSTKPGQPCSPSSTSGVSVMAQSEKKNLKKRTKVSYLHQTEILTLNHLKSERSKGHFRYSWICKLPE